MDFEHGPDCEHCKLGCDHPHDEWEPTGLHIGPVVPGVMSPGLTPGKKGGYIGPGGLTIASDNWHPTICFHCGLRALTPIEAIPIFPFPAHDRAGNLLTRCGPCKADIRDGYKPGQGPHSARARRRARQ